MPDLLEALQIGDEIYREPSRLVAPHAWEGHIPFVYWLVKALRPAMLVELGTHTGNSYFAMCEALDLTGCGGKAFAVDTWEGDEHAGFYGDDVFQSVVGHNDGHFASFSTLLRMFFDEARAYFPDGVIDLLHIDGLHTYEAVRHDFQTWHSALSRRGVVIFHDINVRERGFGVWRLWQELSTQFPGFAFDHSNGLGVLVVGDDAPPTVLKLVQAGRDSMAAGHIRRLFANAGASLTRRLGLDELRDAAPGGSARETLRWSEEALRRAEHLSQTKDTLISLLDEKLQNRDAMLRAYARDIEARDAAILDRESLAASARAETAAALAEIDAERLRNAVALTDSKQRERIIIDHMLRVDAAYRSSTSWRATALLRAITGVGASQDSPVVGFLADLARDNVALPPASTVADPK